MNFRHGCVHVAPMAPLPSFRLLYLAMLTGGLTANYNSCPSSQRKGPAIVRMFVTGDSHVVQRAREKMADDGNVQLTNSGGRNLRVLLYLFLIFYMCYGQRSKEECAILGPHYCHSRKLMNR
jgi:hypothetical protein